MKVRNKKVLRIIGTKTLAGVLALGLTLATPVAALADEEWTEEVTEESTDKIVDETGEALATVESAEETRPRDQEKLWMPLMKYGIS